MTRRSGVLLPQGNTAHLSDISIGGRLVSEDTENGGSGLLLESRMGWECVVGPGAKGPWEEVGTFSVLAQAGRETAVNLPGSGALGADILTVGGKQ